MKDTIYLVISRNGVQSMRKSLPDCKRGEIAVRVHIEVSQESFAPPVIEQRIVIQDPYQGIDLADVHFTGSVITEAEAEMIRRQRLQKAAEILTANGYNVTEPGSDQ